MKHLATIKAFGAEPAPWSTPDIGVSRRPGAKPHRFARAKGKSSPATGRLNCKDWQRFVGDAAREAWGGRKMLSTPVKLVFTFYAETPPGRKHGELWEISLEYNAKTRTFVKRQRFGRGEPDLTNLIKSTEDALKGIVVVDDCASRPIEATPLFGPVPGVRIDVYRVEPEDFPGYGDPVE